MNLASKTANILILGDSVTFPRPNYGLTYALSWFGQLESRLSPTRLWHRGRQGATSKDVLNEADMIVGYLGPTKSFDIAIVQVGIVDCCPRPFPQFFMKGLRTLPGGLKIERWINSKYEFLLKLRAQPWVSDSQFKTNLLGIMDKLEGLASTAIFLQIAPASRRLAEKVPEINTYVTRYNKIINDLSSRSSNNLKILTINPYSDTADHSLVVLEDGHHLSHLGHDLVASKILSIIECLD